MKKEPLNETLKKSLIVIKKLKAELENQRVHQEPIAVVGMGCRFPGNVNDPEALWELLREGKSGIVDIPESRWDTDELIRKNPSLKGKKNLFRAGLLDNIDQFDASFFGISPEEASSLDPRQQLLLQTCWHTLENAKVDPDQLRNSKTGVFVGISLPDNLQESTANNDFEDLGTYEATGIIPSTAAGRISYLLDLKGPSMAVDTACSSSLVSTNLACQSLQSGECDAAIVGGVNLILRPNTHVLLSKMEVISPTGECKTFDAEADGYVRSEGCGMVFLKRLKDARKDGNQVLAVIKGSAVNQDGNSNGLTAPNGLAQQEVMKSALAKAKVSPEEIDYLEAHGTGTSLGDPIEIDAVNRIYGKQRKRTLYIGSVKTNLGHLESVSGIVGLMKAILVLQKGKIPPHLHFKTPSPFVDWKPYLKVPTRNISLKKVTHSRHRAAVSSFGLSGTNVHVILEAPETPVQDSSEFSSREDHLICLSADGPDALQAQADQLMMHLNKFDDLSLAGLSRGLNAGRHHFKYRTSWVAESLEDLKKQLKEPVVASTPKAGRIAFLYTGQGAARIGMGKTLYETEPVFRAVFDHCMELIEAETGERLTDLIFGFSEGAETKLQDTYYTQLSLFALEYSLTRLWQHWGVQPDYLLGHSLGELVAATVAGVFNLPDGIKLVAARARLMRALPRSGKMISVKAGVKEIGQLLKGQEDKVSIACENAPGQTVLSGDEDAVSMLVGQLEAQRFKVKALNTSHAFHSPLMEPMLSDFERVAESLDYQEPSIPVISNLTGKVSGSELAKPGYWVRQIRQTVKFMEGVRELETLGVTTFIEMGPDTVLSGLAMQCVSEEHECHWLPSLKEGTSGTATIYNSLGQWYTMSGRPNWEAFFEGRINQAVSLPNYAFRKKPSQAQETNAYNGPVVVNEKSDKVGPGIPANPLVQKLMALGVNERKTYLTDYLRRHIAAILTLPYEEISADIELTKLGINSLQVLELVNKTKKEFKIKFPVTAFFELKDLHEIGDFILSHVIPEEPASASHEFQDRIRETDSHTDVDAFSQTCPLSSMQERLWFLYQLNPGPEYNVCVKLDHQGPLSEEAVNKAWKTLVDRHDSLRTCVISDEQGVQLRLLSPYQPQIQFEDLSHHKDTAKRLEQIEKQVARYFFDFQNPTLHLSLVKLGETHFRLFIALHHLFTDGYSIQLLVQEFIGLYKEYTGQAQYQLQRKEYQYTDFIKEEIKWIKSEAYQQASEYWQKHLQDTELLQINAPKPQNQDEVTDISGGKLRFDLTAYQTAGLVGMASIHGVTLNTLLFSIYAVLLHKYSGQDNFGISVLNANRSDEKFEQVHGFFVNTLVWRGYFTPDLRFTELLAANWKQMINGQKHHRLPYQKLVKMTGKDHSGIAFSHQSYEAKSLQEEDWTSDDISFADTAIEGVAHFDLELNTIIASDHEAGTWISGSWEYRSGLFDKDFVSQLNRHFSRLIDEVLSNPQCQISGLGLLLPAEKEKVIQEFAGQAAPYPSELSVIDLFNEGVSKSPDACAVKCGESVLTYRELDEFSNHLAHFLLSKDLNDESIIGVCLSRSVEMVIATLGIWKAGLALLPIDPELPVVRLKHIIKDSGTTLILCDHTTEDLLPDLVAKQVINNCIAGVNVAKINIELDASQLAYVNYTSGTTGLPKGVLIEHGSLMNMVMAWRDAYRLDETPMVLLQTARMSFDVYIGDVGRSVLCDGTLIIANEDERIDPMMLVDLMVKHKITGFEMTPALAIPVMKEAVENPGSYQSLRRIMLSSDVLPLADYQWLKSTFGPKGIDVINSFGTTETTIDTSYFNATADHLQQVPIGKAFANTRLYITDRYLNLLPVGVIGELQIGGIQVARGYLNRSELTKQKFIESPFVAGERLYRTGDLARWLPDGNIEFMGRADNQLKVRGYRIETGEVVTALESLPEILQAVVKPHETHGQYELAAYLVSDTNWDEQKLKSVLVDHLPSYMIPRWLIEIQEIPLTANGKVDLKALPAPVMQRDKTDQTVSPVSKTETQLAQIWSTLLGYDQINRFDQFFDLGGHSLLALKMVNQVRHQIGKAPNVRSVFDQPVLADFAKLLDGLGQKEIQPVPVIERPERIPLSFGQERLWFIDQLEGSRHYHMPSLFKLKSEPDTQALSAALKVVVTQHEVLRTVIREAEGQAFQHILIPDDWQLNLHDLRSQEGKKDTLIKDLIEAPFDLARDYMLRASLIRLDQDEFELLLVTHHIATDGWSSQILLDCFLSNYDAICNKAPLPKKTAALQYADYAIWQRRKFEDGHWEKALSYWQKDLEGAPILNLPTDHKPLNVASDNGAQHLFRIDAALESDLRNLANTEGVTVFVLLMAAFKVLLHKYSSMEDIVIGTPVANRQSEETTSMIGFLVSSVAIRSQIDGEMSFSALLQALSQKVLSAFEYQDTPLSAVIEKVTPVRKAGSNPLFQVMFVFQNHKEDTGSAQNALVLEDLPFDFPKSKFDLTLEANEAEDGFWFRLEYKTDIFSEATVSLMALQYVQLLKAVVRTPYESIGLLKLVSPDEERVLLNRVNKTFNDFPQHATIVSLFETQVVSERYKKALVFNDSIWNYGQLNEDVNRLANCLKQEFQLQPDDLVAVKLSHCDWTIVCLLAVLKAGGAYVPIDPTYPEERINYMLNDAKPKLCIDQELLDGLRKSSRHYPVTPPEATISPGSAAYVIYTSGTTGQPKGVVITHSNVVRLLKPDHQLFHFSSNDVWTLFHSLSFDFSVWEMYGALLNGGTLVVVGDDVRKDFQQYVELLKTHQVTVLNQTPSAFYSLAQLEAANTSANLSLRYVIFGGEALAPHKLKEWRERYPKTILINMYGITETTVHVTYKEIGQYEIDQGISNIGVAIPTLDCLILDESRQLLPVNMPGELCIGGAGLARGYLNKPELTAQKFIDHPYAEGKIYLSGDLARRLPNGDLEYLGRIDDQVKIRGYRIELGEVETAISQIDGILQVVVSAKEMASGELQLVAYVVSETNLDVQWMETKTGELLPAYMIPAHWLQIEKIPLTSSGKTDHKSLPVPLIGSDDFVPPENEVETELVQIWKDVLGLDKVGTTDNFFQLGGDSILIIRVLSKIKKQLGKRLEVRNLYESSTIKAIAIKLTTDGQESKELLKRQAALVDKMDHLRKEVFDVIEAPQLLEDVLPMSDVQMGMVFHSLTGEKGVYHDQFVNVIECLDHNRLKQSMIKLVQKHEALRTGFDLYAYSEPVQLIYRTMAVDINVEDLRDKDETVQAEFLKTYMEGELSKPFNLRVGPLWRLSLFDLNDDKSLILFQFHHALLDGWSIATLHSELIGVYDQLLLDETYMPVSLKASYEEHLVEMLSYRKDQTLLDYWKQELSDKERPLLFSEKSLNVRESRIRPLKYAAVEQAAKRYGVSVKSIFLGAYYLLLDKLCIESNIMLGLTAHVRPAIEDGDKILGCFLNVLPFALKTSGLASTWKDYLQAIHEKTIVLQRHNQLSLLELTQMCEGSRQHENPLTDVLFTFVDFHIYRQIEREGEGIPHLKDLIVESYDQTNFFLSLDVNITGQEIEILFDQTRAFSSGIDLKQFTNYYVELLDDIIHSDLSSERKTFSWEKELKSSLNESKKAANGKVDYQHPLRIKSEKLSSEVDATEVASEELLMTRIWEETLGLEHIALDDNFFELGGHSILAIRLVNALNKQFESKMYVRTLFHYPTIRGLVQEMGHQTNTIDSGLQLLSKSADLEPIYIVPGSGGMLISFYPLAELLERKRSLYGFQAYGLDAHSEVITGVKEIAAQNIIEMQQQDPSGPYTLAGYSFGATVIYEMALQLQSKGFEVSQLLVLDAPPFYDTTMNEPVGFTQNLLGLCEGMLSYFGINNEGAPSEKKLRKMTNQEQVAQVYQFIRDTLPPDQLDSLVFDLTQFERMVLVNASSMEAFVRYQPTGLLTHELKVTLFKVVQSDLDTEDSDYGWSNIKDARVEVVSAEGTHHTMLNYPHARHLAQALLHV